jgi:hypothetical protein
MNKEYATQTAIIAVFLMAGAVYQFAVLDAIYELFRDENEQKFQHLLHSNSLSVIVIPTEIGIWTNQSVGERH